MSHLINKFLRSSPIEIIGGDGAWLYSKGGRRILDTCGGVAVSSLGHCHSGMCEALASAAGDIAWVHAGSFTTAAAEELADFLTARSGGLSHVQFLSGGSEAVELALKVSLQYHEERGQPERRLFIARRQSYHGSTLGTLAVSGNRDRRSIFEPILMPALFVAPCYAYRDMSTADTEEAYVARLASELEQTILTAGPERVAAFLAEPVVGSTNGAVPAVPGYFKAIRRVCDQYGVLLIIDDVMSGMGRSGSLFSHIDDGISPDIAVIGKGLAAGYQPISAYLLAPHIYAAIANGSGVLRNGQTHVNHPFACAIALAAQKILERDNLIVAGHTRGTQLRNGLAAALAENPFVGDIRGRGAFLGVEFVSDRSSKAPLDDHGQLVGALKRAALARDLLIYPGSGTADGTRGHHVLLAPPFVATEADIDQMIERFALVMQDVRPLLEKAASSELTLGRIAAA
jgi:adenosylmethionine-8-amino-7-oxononanoate aminotransferase